MNVDSVCKIKVNPQDRFVVSFPGILSTGMASRLRDQISEQLDGAQVIILSCGMTLGVLSQSAPDMVADIAEFHKKFGLAYDGKPRLLEETLANFRIKFMGEELEEYLLATEDGREELENNFFPRVSCFLEQALDALVDLVYVALGTAHLHGFDFNEAWRRVHAANMKKVRAESAEASKNSTGRGHAADVIKPPGWEPPSHKDLVEDHAHK